MKTSVGMVLLLALLGFGAAPGVAGADPAAPAPPPGPKTVIDADGTYAVGVDIVPGVYSSAGPVDGGTCSWRRTSNPDGATVDNALTHQAQVVQIDATDQAFKTRGCQTWQLTNAAVPTASTVSPFIAGLQLQGYLAQLNGRAASSGQLAPPSPAPAAPAPAPTVAQGASDGQ